MSNYTPTTEEVRDVYQRRLIKVSDNRFELIDEAQADAEFDRWLDETKKLAIATSSLRTGFHTGLEL